MNLIIETGQNKYIQRTIQRTKELRKMKQGFYNRYGDFVREDNLLYVDVVYDRIITRKNNMYIPQLVEELNPYIMVFSEDIGETEEMYKVRKCLDNYNYFTCDYENHETAVEMLVKLLKGDENGYTKGFSIIRE